MTTDHVLQPIQPTTDPVTGREATDVVCSCGWRGRTSQSWAGDDLAQKAKRNHTQHVHRQTRS